MPISQIVAFCKPRMLATASLNCVIRSPRFALTASILAWREPVLSSYLLSSVSILKVRSFSTRWRLSLLSRAAVCASDSLQATDHCAQQQRQSIRQSCTGSGRSIDRDRQLAAAV
jgi:hypothetical protein